MENYLVEKFHLNGGMHLHLEFTALFYHGYCLCNYLGLLEITCSYGRMFRNFMTSFLDLFCTLFLHFCSQLLDSLT